MGVVERNKRALGDYVRALLLDGDLTEWDQLLPHIMQTF